MLNNIFEFYVDNKLFSIKLSKHARERMIQREITKEHIIDNILSLSVKDFRHLRKNSLKAIVINNETKANVVFGFNSRSNVVTVVTVIKKKNPYASKGTVKVNL